MRRLEGAERYMYKEFLSKVDKQVSALIANEGVTVVILERIANIIVVRLRRFIRGMDYKGVYELVSKDIHSLKRLKAADRHKIADSIIEFMI